MRGEMGWTCREWDCNIGVGVWMVFLVLGVSVLHGFGMVI